MKKATDLGRSLLVGAVVATLCMFPLLNALSSTPMWLHWRIQDSIETLASWIVAACLVATTVGAGPARARGKARDAIIGLWIVAGMLFVCGGLVKMDRLRGILWSRRDSGGWLVVIVGLLLVAGIATLILHPGRRAASRLETIALRMWPVVPLLFFNLARAPGLADAQTRIRSPAPKQASSTAVATGSDPAVAAHGGRRTVILLFDELSPDYLYGSRAIDLSGHPALRQLREQGQIHATAHLQGGATEYAIPALFASTVSAPQGLVPALRAKGESVRVWGWYHDYCAGMAAGSNACHSNSMYNPRTLHALPSLIDPWWTDLNLLPSAFPFGLMKNPAAVAIHRRTLESAQAWLATQLGDAGADVIYAHLNVPHLPLLDAPAPQAAHPFTMDEAGYLSQFNAVDAVVGQVLRSTTRPTQLIVLSDHNARPLFPKQEHTHVVFIRWRGWAPRGQTVTGAEDAAELVGRMSLDPEVP